MKRFLCAVALMLASVSSFAFTPQEVEQVANVQHNYAQAESMMQQVLKEHPNSAAAHFEMAQVQALEAKIPEARQELQLAKQLDPNLSFDKIGAVGPLEAKLAAPPAMPVAGAPVARAYWADPAVMVFDVFLWIIGAVLGWMLLQFLWEAFFGVTVVQEQIIYESPAEVVQTSGNVSTNRLVRASQTTPTIVARPAVYYPDPVLSSLAVSNMVLQDALMTTAMTSAVVSDPIYDPDPYIPTGGFMDSVGGGSTDWGDSVGFGGGGWGD